MEFQESINEIRNTLEATNSRITEAEDRISEIEDRMVLEKTLMLGGIGGRRRRG